jgi:hypothetical protein
MKQLPTKPKLVDCPVPQPGAPLEDFKRCVLENCKRSSLLDECMGSMIEKLFLTELIGAIGVVSHSSQTTFMEGIASSVLNIAGNLTRDETDK